MCRAWSHAAPCLHTEGVGNVFINRTTILLVLAWARVIHVLCLRPDPAELRLDSDRVLRAIHQCFLYCIKGIRNYRARSLVLARPRDIQAPLGALCPPARAHATPYLNLLSCYTCKKECLSHLTDSRTAQAQAPDFCTLTHLHRNSQFPVLLPSEKMNLSTNSKRAKGFLPLVAFPKLTMFLFS